MLEQGALDIKEEGVAQGGNISPLLANIYLHYVLDLWVESWRKHKPPGLFIRLIGGLSPPPKNPPATDRVVPFSVAPVVPH